MRTTDYFDLPTMTLAQRTENGSMEGLSANGDKQAAAPRTSVAGKA